MSNQLDCSGTQHLGCERIVTNKAGSMGKDKIWALWDRLCCKIDAGTTLALMG